MPMEYTIDENRGVILMRGWGRLANRDMVDCVSRLRADDRLTPGMNTLSDMRDVTDMAIDPEGILATSDIMAASSGWRGRARIAIVVKNLPDGMMAKLFGALSHKDSPELEIKPFESYRKAEEWLGVSPGSAD